MGSKIDDLICHVIDMPWFRKVWILQELILSGDPWVQVGFHRLRWPDFITLIFDSKHDAALVKSSNYNVPNDMRMLRANFVSGTPDSFGPCDYVLKILHSRRGHGVFDPRDMLYGHLALFATQTKSDKPEIEKFLEVDYRKSIADVYTDLTLYLLNQQCDFEFLSHVEDVKFEERKYNLPTWVPDWTSKEISIDTKLDLEERRTGKRFNGEEKGLCYVLRGWDDEEGSEKREREREKEDREEMDRKFEEFFREKKKQVMEKHVECRDDGRIVWNKETLEMNANMSFMGQNAHKTMRNSLLRAARVLEKLKSEGNDDGKREREGELKENLKRKMEMVVGNVLKEMDDTSYNDELRDISDADVMLLRTDVDGIGMEREMVKHFREEERRRKEEREKVPGGGGEDEKNGGNWDWEFRVRFWTMREDMMKESATKGIKGQGMVWKIGKGN
ncbi:hypothetical protein BCON_0117g00060 [Botryotinia convoluta]|uniref:Heterokaryon incompatibility domain-containing protein n=1 Tax=Botryotinia convoluta TaxID=54673 RepID=A0A4Z1HYW8_9HELO|nr:hypothetical protein BCON_0117g00060 [Botryotinia convoluta]